MITVSFLIKKKKKKQQQKLTFVLLLTQMSQQIRKADSKYSSLCKRTQQEENMIRNFPSCRSQQYIACDEPSQPDSTAYYQPFFKDP